MTVLTWSVSRAALWMPQKNGALALAKQCAPKHSLGGLSQRFRVSANQIDLSWCRGLQCVQAELQTAINDNWDVAGTLLTAELALRHGLACNTAGGTHHAHTDFGSGFCILNDMAVAAAALVEAEKVRSVLILDLDVHQVGFAVIKQLCSAVRNKPLGLICLQCILFAWTEAQGDGTACILQSWPEIYTCSVHAAANFPARKVRAACTCLHHFCNSVLLGQWLRPCMPATGPK